MLCDIIKSKAEAVWEPDMPSDSAITAESFLLLLKTRMLKIFVNALQLEGQDL